MKLKRAFFFLLTGIALFLGCESYFENPYFAVEESGLNWLSIRYYNYRQKPIRKVNIRIDGNGIINVRAGTSSLVSNPFAADMKETDWYNIEESRTMIPREDVVPIFQMLVDSGLFVERMQKDSIVTNEAIFVTANIQNKTTGKANDDIFGSNPELAEHLRNIIMMYYHPRPKKRPRAFR